MSDIVLKERCPFCGGMAKICKINEYELGKTAYYTPECETENCVGNNIEGYYETPEEAAEAWDRRASPWRTDQPPKDGTLILGKFVAGPEGNQAYAVVLWCDMGQIGGWGGTICNGIAFWDDPVEWMPIPGISDRRRTELELAEVPRWMEVPK